MKNIFIILTSTVLSSYTMACPNLSATYSCTNSSGENKIIEFSMGTDSEGPWIMPKKTHSKVYIDGETRIIKPAFKYEAFCSSNNEITIEMMTLEGEPLAKTQYIKKNDSLLIVDSFYSKLVEKQTCEQL